tara:strand:- start:270 stop:563 length:294 start_codon:yes stop_codon:yes gene_type:complete
MNEIRYSYTETMEQLVIPRLVWEKPDHEDINSEGEASLIQVPLPDEIKDYLMEAATKADERLKQQVPEVDRVVAKKSDWLPVIKPITTKLRKIGGAE